MALLKLETRDGNREQGIEKQNILSDACKISKYTPNNNMYFQSGLKFTHFKDIGKKVPFHSRYIKKNNTNPALENVGSVQKQLISLG